MKKRFLLLAALTLVGCAGWANRPVTTLTVQNRTEIVQHLRTRYPGFESKLVRVALSLESKYPGLVYTLPRHLLEDLGDEALFALHDVVSAQRAAQGQRPLELLESKYPGLRTRLLAANADDPLAPRVAHVVQSTLQERYPRLRRAALLDASRVMDERFPGLGAEVARNGLGWLRHHRPEFLEAAGRQVLSNHAGEIRRAAIDVLTQLEADPNCRVAPRLQRALEVVDKEAPGLLSDLVDLRQQRLPLTFQVLTTRHPQLLVQAEASLRRHYPGLIEDWQQAVDREIPGFRAEVSSRLQGIK